MCPKELSMLEIEFKYLSQSAVSKILHVIVQDILDLK